MTRAREAAQKNRRNGAAARQRGPEFKGFVNIPLTADEKRAIADDVYNAEDTLEVVRALLEDGYKFSLSLDAAHNAIIATATGKNTGTANDGYALSGRGPTVEAAVRVLWYKHQGIAESGVWTNVQRDSGGDQWG